MLVWIFLMFKVLIVDDERLARVELKRLLQSHKDIEVLGEAKNAKEALNFLDNHSVNLVFVDIHMPEVNGLELVSQFDDDVKFVFCTAFQDYAVEAFAVNAFDYLVKPVNPERLEATLNKLRTIAKSSAVDTAKSYLEDNHGLLLQSGDSKKIVRLKDIERFESMGNYVTVYSAGDKFFIHTSLKKVEKKLNPSIFFKVSRSVILRVDNIKSIEDGFAVGSLIAVLNSGSEVEISRRQAQELKNLFNIWS